MIITSYPSENKVNNRRSLEEKDNSKFPNYFSTNSYINRLIFLQGFALGILFISGCSKITSMATNEWYVLNVNEYIPTSKGGLWSYCFIATTGYHEQYTCMKYEELPNFAVFINQRLYTSRILLLCSGGFLAFLAVIESAGICFLIVTKSKKIDELIQQRKKKLTSTPINDCNKVQNFELTCIRENLLKTKPPGYYFYMMIVLINLVGTSMEIVLKIAGFILFDAYIKQLLSFNTVFLAYKSYSYWLLIISIIFDFIYWFFKLLTTRYVTILNERLIFQNSFYGSARDINGSSDFNDLNIIGKIDANNQKNVLPHPVQKSFVFDINYSNQDDSFTTSIQDNYNIDKKSRINPKNTTNKFAVENKITPCDSPVSQLRF